MLLFYVIYSGPGILILLVCCFVFWRKKIHGFWAYFLLGWAFQVLLSLPAGMWEGLKLTIVPLWTRFLVPLFGWAFNTGGYTIRYTFKATVGYLQWLPGYKSEALSNNMPYYIFLMAVQASILAFIFAVRYKRRKTLIDWVLICLGILFLCNSFAAADLWWGL